MVDRIGNQFSLVDARMLTGQKLAQLRGVREDGNEFGVDRRVHVCLACSDRQYPSGLRLEATEYGIQLLAL